MNKYMNVNQILQLFKPPRTLFPDLILREQASVKGMIHALRTTDSKHARRTICRVLGDRQAKSAIPILIKCLDDSDSELPSLSALSLGKIGDPKAGLALIARLEQENRTKGFRAALITALGDLKFQSAIPNITKLLTDKDHDIRGLSAWFLGLVIASESIPALQQALKAEKDSWAKMQIQNTLDTITNSLKQSD